MAVSLPNVSSTSGTLNAPGIGSGLDVKGLISQLMTLEQKPITALDKQEAGFQSKLSSLGSVKGALATLQSAAQGLVTAGASTYSASVSDAAVLSATAANGAIAGNYNVSIDGSKLAQGQKLVAPGSASTNAAIGNGVSSTLTISFGTITGGPAINGQYSSAGFTDNPDKEPTSLTIDSTNNSLAGIRDAINAASAGVRASIINDGSGTPYRLALAANDTGTSNGMRLSVTGDTTLASVLSYDPAAPAQNFNETQAAQNAQFSVDGVAITSATNSVTDAIPGVTLRLASKAGLSTVTVAVQLDNGKLNSAISSLVNAYNSVNSTIAVATAKGAVMQGEGGVLTLQQQVRSVLGSTQRTGGAYTIFSQLGISFQKDGSLKLDSAKLGAALSASASDVATLVAAIGTALNTAATNMLGKAGPLSSRTDGINRSIRDIGSRRLHLQGRLAVIQQHYQTQFSALDTLMSSMSKTSTFLEQQLANLPGSSTSSKG